MSKANESDSKMFSTILTSPSNSIADYRSAKFMVAFLDKQTDGQTDRQTKTQTDRERTDIYIYLCVLYQSVFLSVCLSARLSVCVCIYIYIVR